jgi:outer membrane protein assembly factor BamB
MVPQRVQYENRRPPAGFGDDLCIDARLAMMHAVSRTSIIAGLTFALSLNACDLLDKAKGEPETAKEEASEEKSAEPEDPKAADATPEAGDEGEEESGEVEAPSGGSSVAWSATGPSQPLDMKVSGTGALVAVYGDKMVGYVDGAEAWAKEAAYTELVRLKDGTMLAAAGPDVVAFEPDTGKVTFERSIEAPAGSKPKKDEPAPGVVGAETFGSQVLLAMADARFFVMDPPSCVKDEPTCLRPGESLAGEYLEPSAVLKVANDGTRFLGEDDTMRAFNLALELQFELAAAADIVGITTVGNDRLALAFGGEIALLDSTKCVGRTEIRLAKNRNNIAPKGCVMWRYGGELDNVAPAVIDDSTLAANGNQRLQAVINGVDSWKSPLGSVGRVVAVDAAVLYTMTVVEAEDGSMSTAVAAVDAEKGTVNWSAPLPFAVEDGAVVVVDSLSIDWQPGWIAVAKDAELAVVSVPGEADE